jgi:hypothetical protein
VQLREKNFQHLKKNKYSMIEVLAKISSKLQLYCILKYIHKKMYVVEKKITGWIVLQYKIIITKYQNIAINSFSMKHEHAHEVVVKKYITSHNKRGEQAFLY